MTLFKDSNTRMSKIMSSKIIINAHWIIGSYTLKYQPQNIPQHTCKAANNTNFVLVYFLPLAACIILQSGYTPFNLMSCNLNNFCFFFFFLLLCNFDNMIGFSFTANICKLQKFNCHSETAYENMKLFVYIKTIVCLDIGMFTSKQTPYYPVWLS